MSTHNEMPDRLRRHLESVVGSSGLPPGEESFSRIAEFWREKRRLFEGKIQDYGMKEIDCLAADDPRGAIAMTYSGSLISLGCIAASLKPPNSPKDGRWFEYVSIKLRKDVPNIVMAQCVELVGDLKRDAVAEFRLCPIKKSSEILLIAVFEEDAAPAEQEKRIRQTTADITEGFIELNKELGIPDN